MKECMYLYDIDIVKGIAKSASLSLHNCCWWGVVTIRLLFLLLITV